MAAVKARISAKAEDMVDVQSVTVFGLDLTRDYAEFDVPDAVLAKLKGNPTIDVMVKKGAATADPEPAPEPTPEPEPAVEPAA